MVRGVRANEPSQQHRVPAQPYPVFVNATTPLPSWWFSQSSDRPRRRPAACHGLAEHEVDGRRLILD
jgi:hypothetical protein